MPEAEKHRPLYFLKLGGSLITVKSKAHTARMDVLSRLAGEVAESLKTQPGYHLVVGHGSGSFGHIPGKRFGTRTGVHTPDQWRGFSEVWYEATALTRIVVEALYAAGLPVIAFSPSSSAIARDGAVANWDLSPLKAALQAGLLPLIHGDVVFDQVRGGTILSTEDLFGYMVQELQPERVLLAGLEEGVWADYPHCSMLIPEITPDTLPDFLPSLGGSSATDVTGGMLSKVQQSMEMVIEHPDLSVQIFSGTKPGNIRGVLAGAPVGTILRIRRADTTENRTGD
jgi:isopentenyl phosphate kinase